MTYFTLIYNQTYPATVQAMLPSMTVFAAALQEATGNSVSLQMLDTVKSAFYLLIVTQFQVPCKKVFIIFLQFMNFRPSFLVTIRTTSL